MGSQPRRVFARDLTDGFHHRHFAVERASEVGWQVLEESETEVIRQITYDDWHRVELAIRGFSLEAAELKRRGWHEG